MYFLESFGPQSCESSALKRHIQRVHGSIGCKDESVTLPAGRPSDRPQPGLDTRARVVFGTGRRQFVHVWTAPRSPAARVVVVPLLLLATLVILAVGLFALLALLAVAFVLAAFFFLVGVPFAAIRKRTRSRAPAPRPPRA
jgi:hypothetical protein